MHHLEATPKIVNMEMVIEKASKWVEVVKHAPNKETISAISTISRSNSRKPVRLSISGSRGYLIPAHPWRMPLDL